ncbi:MAG: hypothetical protein AAB425_14770 [Bdellovibrionota bacterium]
MKIFFVLSLWVMSSATHSQAATTDIGGGGMPHCDSLCRLYATGNSNTACTVTKTAVTPTAYTRNSTAGCGLGEVLVETVDKNNNRTTKCYDSLCASSGTEPLNGLICASAATIYCAKVVGN